MSDFLSDAGKRWHKQRQKMWNDYKGFKAAFGENPTSIDPRGHHWMQKTINNGNQSGRWLQTSYQVCRSCLAMRRVVLHPGLLDNEYWAEGGSWGDYSVWKDCVEQCKKKPPEGEVK